MEQASTSKVITVFLNGKIDKKCEVQYYRSLTIPDIISNCKEKLKINNHNKCKLLDSRGEQLSDDDLEFINSEEPLFLSQGEKFLKSSSMAIYNEIRKLGQGGFGSVFLYKNKLTNQDVAIKFIDLKTIMTPEDVNRLYSEISILRGLKHPNIVDLIDVFDLDNRSCFVMEYCSGGELMEYIKEKEILTEEEVHSLGAQMVDAVRYCHNSKVIHRDLKPENVLFSNSSKTVIKIVDFGIAGMFSVGRIGEASEAGSLLYTAPEVISGRDIRAAPALDVWSLGCIIYMMLTGTHPFLGKTYDSTIQKIIAAKHAPLPPTVAKHWDKFFEKIFKINPEERWTMLEISSYFDKLRYGADSSDEESESESEEDKVEDIKKEPVITRQLARNMTHQNPTKVTIEWDLCRKKNASSMQIKKFKSQAALQTKKIGAQSKVVLRKPNK